MTNNERRAGRLQRGEELSLAEESRLFIVGSSSRMNLGIRNHEEASAAMTAFAAGEAAHVAGKEARTASGVSRSNQGSPG